MKPRHCLPVVGLLAGLALAPRGDAAVITYTSVVDTLDEVDFAPSGAYSANLSALVLLSLQRFDASLGTLRGVELFLRGRWEGLVEASARDDSEEGDFIPLPPFIINTRNDAAISARLDTTLRFSLLDPDGPSFTFNVPDVSTACTDTRRDGFGITECESSGDGRVDIDRILALGALPLSAFIGTNPLDLSMSLTSRLSGYCDDDDGGDLCSVRAYSDFLGSAGVRYTYDLPGEGGGGPGGDGGGGGGTGGDPVAVPEPGSLGLLAVGLLGLAWRSRRVPRAVESQAAG